MNDFRVLRAAFETTEFEGTPRELPSLAQEAAQSLRQRLEELALRIESGALTLSEADLRTIRSHLTHLSRIGEQTDLLDRTLRTDVFSQPLPGGTRMKHYRFRGGAFSTSETDALSDVAFLSRALEGVLPELSGPDSEMLHRLETAFRDYLMICYAVWRVFFFIPLPAPAAMLILAGGAGKRMGQPKPWLDFEGRPLLLHLEERCPWLFSASIVVAAPGQDLPPTASPVLPDEAPGEGPLAGLGVGLREIRQPLAFVASCDLPFLNPALVAYLLDRAEGYDAVVPEWDGRLHPLHAVYRTAIQPIVQAQLESGRRRVMELLDHLRVRRVSDHEIAEIDPGGLSLMNLNTPEDYDRALALWPEWRKHRRNPT